MIKHTHTEPTKLNFSKLEEKVMQVNDPYLGKYNDIREMLYELTIDNKPTLILIKTDQHRRFGGFTQASFESTEKLEGKKVYIKI